MGCLPSESLTIAGITLHVSPGNKAPGDMKVLLETDGSVPVKNDLIFHVAYRIGVIEDNKYPNGEGRMYFLRRLVTSVLEGPEGPISEQAKAKTRKYLSGMDIDITSLPDDEEYWN